MRAKGGKEPKKFYAKEPASNYANWPTRKTLFPPDPNGLPEHIIQKVLPQFAEAEWEKILKRYREAVRSKIAAQNYLITTGIAKVLGTNCPFQIPAGRPSDNPYEDALLSVLCAENFDWDDVTLDYLKEGTRRGGFPFLKNIVAFNELWEDKSRGFVPYQFRDVLLIRNWIRFHDLNEELPGLCWFNGNAQEDALEKVLEFYRARAPELEVSSLSKPDISPRIRALKLKTAKRIVSKFIGLPTTVKLIYGTPPP